MSRCKPSKTKAPKAAPPASGPPTDADYAAFLEWLERDGGPQRVAKAVITEGVQAQRAYEATRSIAARSVNEMIAIIQTLDRAQAEIGDTFSHDPFSWGQRCGMALGYSQVSHLIGHTANGIKAAMERPINEEGKP